MSANGAQDFSEGIAEGTTIGDHYVVRHRLGAGGMGEVYLAEHATLPDLRYAIKVLRADLSTIDRYAQLLEDEAHRQARLQHGNVVKLYDYVRWRQRHCLILAFVAGRTLADLIAAEPDGLPEERALDLIQEILSGLNHAHEHGVLHCDVKPGNVLVDAEQHALVTDFGIARDIGRSAKGGSGLVVGTPEYMSPEQITDPDRVDHRADVFSAGVVLFEMLTGRLPFAQREELRYPQLETEPADIRDYRRSLWPRLSRIVNTALQRDPAERWQGCIAFKNEIVGYRRYRRWRKTWLPAIVITVFLALAGAVASYEWKRMTEVHAEEERQALIKKQRESERRIQRDAERKTIDSLIVSAVKQLGFLCRESPRLESRQKALTTAKSAGFADLVDKFRTQIEDMRKNMAEYSNGYGKSIAQLAKLNPALVTEALDARPRDEPESARFLETIRSDHARLAGQRGPRSESELLASCPS